MRILAIFAVVFLSVSSVHAQSGRRGGFRGNLRRQAPARSYQSAPAEQSNVAQPGSTIEGDVVVVEGEVTAGCPCAANGAVAVPCCASSCCKPRRHRSHCRPTRCRRRR